MYFDSGYNPAVGADHPAETTTEGAVRRRRHAARRAAGREPATWLNPPVARHGLRDEIAELGVQVEVRSPQHVRKQPLDDVLHLLA